LDKTEQHLDELEKTDIDIASIVLSKNYAIADSMDLKLFKSEYEKELKYFTKRILMK
jgi:hypothetical protein